MGFPVVDDGYAVLCIISGSRFRRFDRQAKYARTRRPIRAAVVAIPIPAATPLERPPVVPWSLVVWFETPLLIAVACETPFEDVAAGASAAVVKSDGWYTSWNNGANNVKLLTTEPGIMALSEVIVLLGTLDGSVL